MPETTKEKPIITRSDIEVEKPEGEKPTEGLEVSEIPLSPAEREVQRLGEAWERLRTGDPEKYRQLALSQPVSETAPTSETLSTQTTQPTQPKEKISSSASVAADKEGQPQAAALEEQLARNKE